MPEGQLPSSVGSVGSVGSLGSDGEGEGDGESEGDGDGELPPLSCASAAWWVSANRPASTAGTAGGSAPMCIAPSSMLAKAVLRALPMRACGTGLGHGEDARRAAMGRPYLGNTPPAGGLMATGLARVAALGAVLGALAAVVLSSAALPIVLSDF